MSDEKKTKWGVLKSRKFWYAAGSAVLVICTMTWADTPQEAELATYAIAGIVGLCAVLIGGHSWQKAMHISKTFVERKTKSQK
jgi:hypothetical protein